MSQIDHIFSSPFLIPYLDANKSLLTMLPESALTPSNLCSPDSGMTYWHRNQTTALLGNLLGISFSLQTRPILLTATSKTICSYFQPQLPPSPALSAGFSHIFLFQFSNTPGCPLCPGHLPSCLGSLLLSIFLDLILFPQETFPDNPKLTVFSLSFHS